MEHNKSVEKGDSADKKEVKLSPLTKALFVGFLFGIIIFSVVKSTLGFFTLIPLYILYRLIKSSNDTTNWTPLIKGVDYPDWLLDSENGTTLTQTQQEQIK